MLSKHDHTSVDRREEASRVSQALVRLQFYQLFVRTWAAALSASEFAVMAQIVDRTVGWGKKKVEVTTATLLRGDGRVYAGLDMHRATLFRTLTSLEEKGCIVRIGKGDRIVLTINTGWEPEMIAVPKRFQKSPESPQSVAGDEDQWSQYATTPSQYATSPVAKCDTYKGIGEENTGEANGDLRHGGTCAEEATLIGRMKNVDASTDKLARTRLSNEGAWRAEFKATFPGVPSANWTIKDKGRVRQYERKWQAVDGMDFQGFLRWAISNWTQIIEAEFAWMTQNPPPKTPELGFLLGQFGRFVDVLAERKLEAWLKDADRTELERLMGRGMTRDEALREIGATDAAKKLRREMRERETKLGDRLKQAKMSEQRAERLTTYGGGALIHPRSRAANEMREAARKAAKPNGRFFGTATLLAPEVRFPE